MKKIILSFFVLTHLALAEGQVSTYGTYRVIGYFPQTAAGDYVITYGYYDSNGHFVMSHCRTNAMTNFYSNQTYLDINTCTLRPIPGAVVSPVPPTGF